MFRVMQSRPPVSLLPIKFRLFHLCMLRLNAGFGAYRDVTKGIANSPKYPSFSND